MNRYVQVAKTYLGRPRFWVLGTAYLATNWFAFSSLAGQSDEWVLASALVACLFLCFVGLHVRRQFGADSARLMPDFTVPHLIVWILLSGLFWVVIPAGLMLVGWWPSGALAIHAVAGILAGAVAFWPPAIVGLLALPVILYWTILIEPEFGRSFFERLAQGELPTVGAALLLAAIVSHAIAAFVLIRQPTWGTPTNDEMALDSRTFADANLLAKWILSGRDAAAERLARTQPWRAILRWRVPVAVSLFQLILPAIVVALSTAIGWLMDSVAEWAILSAGITSLLVLVVPYSVWHLRRRVFDLELMRPVTRECFVRQIMLALAWDVCQWALVASLISACVFPLIVNTAGFNTLDPRFVVGYLEVLWGMALFTYGVGMATLRRRMWLLLVVSAGMTWLIGMPLLISFVANEIQWHSMSGLAMFTIFAFFSTCVGISLAWSRYRRWLTSDLA